MADYRACKIVACYFGERRTAYNSPQNPERFLREKFFKYEELIVSGADHDTIFVINGDSPVFHGTSKWTFETRENSGGSVGAYSYAYEKYRHAYDYFLFCEDDVVLTANYYFSRAIAQLESDRKIGFIALSPIGYFNGVYHAGGGFGVSSRERLDLIAPYGRIPYRSTNNDLTLNQTYGVIENNELTFTGAFQDHARSIVNLQGCSPLARNAAKHLAQKILGEHTGQIVYEVGW